MKKIISSILISFVFFINFFVPFSVSLDGKINKSVAQAGGEKVEITVDAKKDGNLGININGTFTTNIKNDNIDVFYFIVKDLNTYVDNGVWQEKITPEPTVKTVSGEKIYTYSFGQQLYQFSDKKVYYDVINGDTYFAKVVVLRTPVTGGPQLKYESNSVEFMAGTPQIKKTDTPEPVTPKVGDVTNKTKYTFLAPLGSIKCMDSSGQDKTCIGNNIGEYLNFIFKFAIGLCAALAVLMLIMAGITYMGDESIFGKTEAKHKMMASIGGLLIALAAWALLNTINPDLTGKNSINITGAKITIQNFDVSGAATFDGKPISINFNKEAYPAAKIASQKTGVETAFILAMFAQETSNGSNTGKCNYNNANMGDGQLEALKRVASKLSISDISTINMSCSGGGSTHGGAIGLTQFIPTTWEMYATSAKSILGHEPNPWNTADALMMTALFLKNNGGAGSNIASQENAACKYFGSCAGTVSCGGGVTGTYGQCILGKKVSIQNQIDESIKKGEIN